MTRIPFYNSPDYYQQDEDSVESEKQRQLHIQEQLEELNKIVYEFVDRQYGHDCGGGCVVRGGEYIILHSHGSISREEWIECGNELIEILDLKGLGKYEVN